ncbi:MULTISPECIES: hypothetical protein [Ralstonia solanacearum species complex]|uniref:hypothetical protein n=1 Tax=Ralstonia solanacearum species complex TaxID=3116862 RepID=UPI00114081B9|nr:hypothetical protein [Ralstonia solanacearum]
MLSDTGGAKRKSVMVMVRCPCGGTRAGESVIWSGSRHESLKDPRARRRWLFLEPRIDPDRAASELSMGAILGRFAHAITAFQFDSGMKTCTGQR